MQPFAFHRAHSIADAVNASNSMTADYIAGGTLLLDLMKLGTIAPQSLIDINDLREDLSYIKMTDDALILGSLVRMADAADDDSVKTRFPLIAQSLQLAASAQLRNMASLGGNVLQRTRCPYYRDPSWDACNKRNPGSGCTALEGINRKHAVLGVSDACISAYPGDFAQALIALEAQVKIVNADGARTIDFSALHLDSSRPEVETILRPGDLITEFTIPAKPWYQRSLYLKIRDRQSYEFALASTAVALDLDGDVVRDVRLALGGVAYKPWRALEAEAELRGKPLTLTSMRSAADAALSGAKGSGSNEFKIELAKRTIERALVAAKDLEI